MPDVQEQKQEEFRGGQVLVKEPQRLNLTEAEIIRNMDHTFDGGLEVTPGYEVEVEIPRRRQIAAMETDENWTGSYEDFDTTAGHFRFGFSGLRITTTAPGGPFTAIYQRGSVLAFLDDFADTDNMYMNLYHTDRSEILWVKLRFFASGGQVADYQVLQAALTAGDNQATALIFQKDDFTLGAGFDWANVTEVHLIVESQNGGGGGITAVTFDDIYIESATETDPITGLRSFERLGSPQRYAMIATSDMIYSWDGVTLTKRQAMLAKGRMVHMIIANDMIVAANGSDNVKRWDPSQSAMMDFGVPAPSAALSGADDGGGGNMAAGTYYYVYTLVMGKHGEGNPSAASAAVVIAGTNQKAALSAILVGPDGTTARRVYRTNVNPADSSAPKYFVLEISNNTDTTASDTKSDALLGDLLVEDGNKPGAAAYLAHVGREFFIAGVATAKSSVFWSNDTGAATKSIEQFPVLNEKKFSPDDNDQIVGLIPFRDILLVFKRFSLHAMDPATKATRQLSPVFGAASQRGIFSDGQVVMFWSPYRGPIIYDGAGFREVGLKVKGRREDIQDAHKINPNLLSTTLNGVQWTFQEDWKTGIGGTGTPAFTDTNADDAVGAVQVDHGGNQTRPTNLSLLDDTLATDSNFTNATGQFPGQAKDDDLDTGWELTINPSVPTGAGGSLKMSLNENRFIGRAKATFTKEANTLDISMRWRIWYFNASGNWVQIQTGIIVIDNTQKTIDISFPSVDAKVIRLSLETLSPNISTAKVVKVLEMAVYEQGYEAVGSWRSDIKGLASSPSAWGRLNAQAGIPSGTSLTVKMRSGANAGVFTTALPWTTVLDGTVPSVALNDFVQFEVDFVTDGINTPRLDELTLLFQASAAGMIAPLFEGAGIYYDDRFWYSQVRQDQPTPDKTWKFFGGGWSEHDDQAMSCWERHGDALLSGSAVDGIVYRNMKDDNGVRIKTRDSRRIFPFLRTQDFQLTGQERDKTILEALLTCRNESTLIVDRDLILNGGFEDWTGKDPAGWTSSTFGFLRHFYTERDQRNIAAGLVSGRFTILSSMVGIPNDWTIRQSVKLRNSERYTLRFKAKAENGPITMLRLHAVMSSGTDQYLTGPGPWSTTVTDIASLFTFDANMNEYSLDFVAPSDIENATEVRLIFGYSSGSAAGQFWLDDVSILPSETSFGFLVNPILDRMPKLPAQRVLLRRNDLAVIKERIPVDEAGVRNFALELTMDEAEASGKIMGIWVRCAREALRDG